LPEFRSFSPGARETGIDPLSNNPPLELSKYTQHLKHVKEQAAPLFMQALEYAEQVGQRSTEPIH
jgi:hypothetical protein